jgi:AcrR family transcriptional regulator
MTQSIGKNGRDSASSVSRQKDSASQNIRGRIIDCATGLLGREGYGAMSVSAICKLAEVSAPTLYWHFGNKEGLLAELLKHSLRIDADAFLSIDISEMPRHEAFELYLAALRNIVVSERPNNWVILSSLSEARHAAPEIAGIIAEARRIQVDYNAEQLRLLWHCRHSQMLVHLWLSYCNYISLLYHDTKTEKLVDDAIDSFRRAFYLLVAALSEDGVNDEGFQEALLKADYDPAPLVPPRPAHAGMTQSKSKTERKVQ